jgi:hypothetical protein
MLRFLATAFFLTAQAHAQFTVRIVTIAAPELSAVRASLMYPPADDDGLRKELLPYFAEPVCDMLLRCGPGRSKLLAVQETPYATEFDPPVQPWHTTLPSAFAVKNVGLTAEVEIKPGTSGQPHIITIALDRVADDGLSTFPLLSSPSSLPILQPRFTLDRITATFPLTSGKWRLIGITRPLAPTSAPDTPVRPLLTFVQVVDTTGAKSIASSVPENRLHLLTFRILAAEGMNLATRPVGNDAALLDSLLRRADTGDILLTGHAACLVYAPENPAPEPSPATPVEPDPFAARPSPNAATRSFAEAASIMGFPYATEYDPDPHAFACKNTGHRLSVVNSTLEWEALDDPVKMLPCSPVLPETTSVAIPEFATQSLHVHAGLPTGAVRMAGAMLLPDDGGPRMMHVHFLKNAGTAAPAPPSQSEVHCAAFSLTLEDTARLSTLPADKQFDGLQSLITAGSARVLAWQSAAGPAGTNAAARRYTVVPGAAGSKVRQRAGFLWPNGFQMFTIGNILELKLPFPGSPLTGEFTVNLNRPLVPSLAEFRTAAANGGALPRFEPVKLHMKWEKDISAPLISGTPRLRFLPPSKLPPDHLDHGRRHVAMILIRK